MIQIEASILNADYSRFGEQAREAEAAGIKAIQIDVMDGRYVPNITFGAGLVKALRSQVDVLLDADLMIVEPEKHIDAFADAGADRIIIHFESCTNHTQILKSIRKHNVEAGIATAPGTSVHVLEPLLDEVDFIQIMTVTPGWGGQSFQPRQLDEVRQLRSILEKRNLQIPIGVDGGIKLDTAPLVAEAGATNLVVGTGLYNTSATVAENVKSLLSCLNED